MYFWNSELAYLNIHDDLLWQKGDARSLCWYFDHYASCVTTNAQYLTHGT